MARANDAGGTFVNAHVANTGTVKVGPRGNKEKRAKQHIAAGEEIFIQYGQHYWSKWGPRKEPEGAARQAIIATKAEAKRAQRVREAARAGAGRGRKRAAASASRAGKSSEYSDEVELDLGHTPPPPPPPPLTPPMPLQVAATAQAAAAAGSSGDDGSGRHCRGGGHTGRDPRIVHHQHQTRELCTGLCI